MLNVTDIELLRQLMVVDVKPGHASAVGVALSEELPAFACHAET